MADPVHSRRLFVFAAALWLIGAAFLRLNQIDRRLFHADEAVQAYQTWQLLRGNGYTYDPADKHGPFLYYAAAGIAKISGWSPKGLNETRLRSITLLAGLSTLALMLSLGSRLGRGAVLIGTALLAAAPLAIIYDTYFVQEAWFCFFTWALFFAAMRWWGEINDGVGRDRWARRKDDHGRPSGPSLPSISRKPTFAGAAFIGALAGLMQATKETSVLHFAALGVALTARWWCALTPMRLSEAELNPVVLGGTRPPDGFSPANVASTHPKAGFHLAEKIILVSPHLLTALLAAAFVYVIFYSSFFTHWAGVIDGMRTYFAFAARAGGSAHGQPWYYYFSLFSPHSSAGVRWGEPLLLLVAVTGMIFAFSSRANLTQHALAVFTLTLLLIYSVIPYKTPWLMLTPYVGLTLLAGLGAIRIAQWLPARFVIYAPGFLCLAVLLECAWNDHQALGRYASDDRNPYVYQPTSSDLSRLIGMVGALPAARKIAVISPDHAWPLPWYWRDRVATGYFATLPENLAAYDLVLFDSRLDSPLPASFAAYGLRPNVILWCHSQ